MALPQATEPLINIITNMLVKLDSEILFELEEHWGKWICFELTDLDQKLYFQLTQTKIHCDYDFFQEPHALIRGQTRQLFQFATQKTQSRSRIHLAGDLDLLQDLQEAMTKVDFDIEDLLSDWFGDEAGHLTGQIFKKTFKKAKRVLANRTSDLQEYLLYEIEMLPTDVQIQNFLRQVDELAARIDRLDALLKQKLMHKKERHLECC